MELPSKILEQKAFDTRPKIEEQMLSVMDKSTHEGHFSQPSKTNNKQFKTAVPFLTGYNGIFNLTNENKFYFTVSIIDDAFNQMTVAPGAYEIESLSNQIKRFIIKEGCFSEENDPFVMKPNFSTSGSVIEIKPVFVGSEISFVHDNKPRDILVFNPEIIYETYYLSPQPVDII